MTLFTSLIHHSKATQIPSTTISFSKWISVYLLLLRLRIYPSDLTEEIPAECYDYQGGGIPPCMTCIRKRIRAGLGGFYSQYLAVVEPT